MNSTKIEPKYITKSNPRVGLIALASDFMIERDFINVIKDRDRSIGVFVLTKHQIRAWRPMGQACGTPGQGNRDMHAHALARGTLDGAAIPANTH